MGGSGAKRGRSRKRKADYVNEEPHSDQVLIAELYAKIAAVRKELDKEKAEKLTEIEKRRDAEDQLQKTLARSSVTGECDSRFKCECKRVLDPIIDLLKNTGWSDAK